MRTANSDWSWKTVSAVSLVAFLVASFRILVLDSSVMVVPNDYGVFLVMLPIIRWSMGRLAFILCLIVANVGKHCNRLETMSRIVCRYLCLGAKKYSALECENNNDSFRGGRADRCLDDTVRIHRQTSAMAHFSDSRLACRRSSDTGSAISRFWPLRLWSLLRRAHPKDKLPRIHFGRYKIYAVGS